MYLFIQIVNISQMSVLYAIALDLASVR